MIENHPDVGRVTDHHLYQQLDEGLLAIEQAIKKGATWLVLPVEYDPAYAPDAYDKNYLGEVDEAGHWCSEAALQHQHDDVSIMAYEQARVVYCLGGCTSDCRPQRFLRNQPLRRSDERRYLLIEPGRLVRFDVNAMPDPHGGVGLHDPAGSFVITQEELNQRIEEMATYARWAGLRGWLRIKGYSLLIAGPKPSLRHRPLPCAAIAQDWCCRNSLLRRFNVERTIHDGTPGQSLREVTLPIEPGWADEYRAPTVSCSRRPVRLPVAARRPRQARLPPLVDRAEQPDWWLPQSAPTDRTAAVVQPQAAQISSTSSGRVKEEPAPNASPDLGDDIDWAPASD